MAHTFNPGTREEKAGRSLSSRTAWSTEPVHKETLSHYILPQIQNRQKGQMWWCRRLILALRKETDLKWKPVW